MEKPKELPSQRWDRLMWGLLILMGGGLILSFPRFGRSVSGGDEGTARCLRNLQLIGLAYSQYARDYDGMFPLGVDPEDRANPQIWRESPEFGSNFFQAAQQTPYLHEVLRPYVSSAEVFHCPDDDGWTKSQLPAGLSMELVNVKPSSFAKFGTSYYCLTKFNFTRMTLEDVENPAATLLLFDGDVWHGNPRRSLNGLYADGHVANLSSGQFAAGISR